MEQCLDALPVFISDKLLNCLGILPAALGPGVHSASNINEYQKQKNNYVTGE
jgi:hypothetical protein